MNQHTPTDQAVLEGSIAITAALKSRSREIHTLYIRRDKWERDILGLEKAARSAGVTVERVDSGVIDAHAGGTSHGGVVALAGPRKFVDLATLVAGRPLPFLVMLDGVEDPYNFGYAVRSLYAAGADGLVVRPRNWMSAAGVVARASAGASELIPTAVAETALDAAILLKEQGLAIACTAHKQAVSIYDADLAIPLFLVIGGERRGITRSFLDKADLLLQIPYGRDFSQSLGTTAAAAILSFEIMRQRNARSTRA